MIQLRCASPFQTGTSRTSLRVRHNIGAVHLHQVGFQPESGLTGTGAANHQYIFVSGSLGVLGAAVHGQALRFRQNHIFLKYRINVRCNILTGSPGSVTLSGQEFALAAEKTGKAATLEGVFSVAGSEKWTYGDHFVNIAVDAIFPDSKAAGEATLEQLQAGKGAFEAYAKALDLKTANATTPRGPELINATTNGYDPSVATFANSKAIFLKQGNWAYENIKKANADIVDTLTFLPIKMPFTQDDIKVEGLTVEHMLESIPVFVPNYYCINDKVSDEEKELAEEFLVWLNTTEAGQKFVVEEMSFIPYNADPATTSAGYSLGDSIISYMAADKTLTNAYAGAPKGWATDNFGLQMMENYVNTAEWPETAYSDIADYAISSWAEMAGLE